MAKWSSQHNGKYPDPYSKIKLDEEKKVKKKKKKKDKDKNRDSILSSLDPNTNTKVNVHLNMCGICRNIWECEKLINMTRIVTRVALPAFYVLFCICFLVYGMAQ